MSLRARLLSLLMVVALLSSANVFARVQWVCRMSGRVGTACCCGHSGAKSRPRAAEFRNAGCCDASVQKGADRLVVDPPAAPRVAAADAAAVILAEPAVPDLGRVARRVSPPRSRAPPPLGPPLYIRNCAFLS